MYLKVSCCNQLHQLNSGLYDYLLPICKKETDIDVYAVAAGTVTSNKNARIHDGDALRLIQRT